MAKCEYYNIQKQIEETEKKLAELKDKLKQEQDKTEWLYIPELKIEVQTKIHHLNKTLSKAMKDLKKDERVITYEEIQWLRNSKYAKQLNLINTWEFVYPNPDKISEKNNYVARFVADSGRAYLSCDGCPAGTFPSLGCRFVKKRK
jgi:hypothetical protein